MNVDSGYEYDYEYYKKYYGRSWFMIIFIAHERLVIETDSYVKM